jgi:regulator of protease activity HflC (stomatin/prohibitin superfamily)
MPGRSYGLAIARRLGIPPHVLADAESRVSDAERSLDALLEAAESRERRLAADQVVLADRLADAEREQARLAAEAEQQAGPGVHAPGPGKGCRAQGPRLRRGGFCSRRARRSRTRSCGDRGHR